MIQQKRTIFNPSKDNHDFLERMKKKGVDKSSIINLALNILAPRLGNLGTTDSHIYEAIFTQKVKRIEETLTKEEFDF